MNCKSIILLIVVLLFWGNAEARKKKGKKVEEVQTESAYRKFFKGKACETAKGMITLHKMDGRVYFEIPLALMGREMLMGSTISEITNNGFGSVGEKPKGLLYISFVRCDSVISLKQLTVQYDTNEENLKQRIKESTIPATIKNFKITTYNEDSTAVVIDMTDYLVSADEAIDPFSPWAPILAGGERVMEKEFRRENSQVVSIKAFEDNVSVKSSLTYGLSLKNKVMYIFQREPFTVVMTRSFILLPEHPMRPRLADPRIAIFSQGVSAFNGDSRGAQARYYAQRWNLEPKDMEQYRKGVLTEPKKPIVFYVDNTFPENWKKYIKEGVEVWQMAFEKIGFKNAIVARDFPVDDVTFDPDNLKYSCVRYSPSWVANAMGPSWTDPRTGEIINASVYLYHNLVKMVQNWRFIQTGPADANVRKIVFDEETLGECIRYVVSHEIGHCLGFMHNMAASSAIPVDSLRSPSFTQKYGTTYSIMDYARNNYVAQPGDKEKGVKLTPPDLGLYDLFTVAWSYTPLPEAKTSEEEVPVLDRWITEKSGDLIYRYGKQQMYMRLDPSSFEEDLGDDPVKAAGYGIQNLKYVLAHLSEWVKDTDKDYTFRQGIYNEIVYQYVRYLNHVTFNIGGVYLNERYDGDARPGYQVVSNEKQERALQFLLEQVKDLTWLNARELRKTMPLMGDVTEFLEDEIFKILTNRLNAVAINVQQATEKDLLTPEVCIHKMYDFIFAPTKQGKSLSAVEKKLQIKFVAQLISNSGVVAKDMGGQPFTLATERQMVAIPEAVKAKSREMYGEIPVQYVGIFTNISLPDYNNVKKDWGNVERQGFDFLQPIAIYPVQMSSLYFNMLKRTQVLLRSKQTQGNDDTRMHYKLLLYKIEQALK